MTVPWNGAPLGRGLVGIMVNLTQVLEKIRAWNIICNINKDNKNPSMYFEADD